MIRAAFRGRLGQFDLDVAFATPARGITALFGPSGCGKTSVLRCMAGLLRLKDGSCAVDGEIWQDASTFRPPHRRPVGYVFQEASLFSHLDVRRNLLYGAPRRSEAAVSAGGFDDVVDLLGLGTLLGRAPRHLSGGERQRVALGRALLSQPRILLMDEPLAALDARTKDEILPFLERLHARLSLPVIYVSHDMAEVERLADQIVLMEAGRVVASGPLGAVQNDPALPLAGRRDAAVSLDAVVLGHDAAYGLLRLAVEGGEVLVPAAAGPPGQRRRLRIAAADVSLAMGPPRGSTILNALPGRILSATPAGAHEMLAVIGLGPAGTGARLLSRVSRRSWEGLGLGVGAAVYAQVKGVALVPQADRI